MSPKNDGFKDFILDQLTELNGMTARAMFGGYGLYQRAAFFGIIHKGRLYFKVSTTTVYEVPIDVIEDAEFLTQWAIEAAKG